MTTTTRESCPSATRRRVGYAVAAAVNTALLYLVNVRPGWGAVSFLTVDTAHVVGLVNLALTVGIVANLFYLFEARPWIRSLGDLVSSSIGLVVAARILQVFPFAFGDSSINWALIVRVVLLVAVVGTAIAIVIALVSLIRKLL